MDAPRMTMILMCVICVVTCTAQVAPSDVIYRHPDFANTSFRSADSVAALYPKHELSDLFALTMKLTKPFDSDEQKLRSIFRWVCSNVEIDYPLFVKNRHFRSRVTDPEKIQVWNERIRRQTIGNLLTNFQTLCSGYAWLVQQMCAYAGLEAVVVDGYGRTHNVNVGTGFLNHSWNAVRLNNNWYLCDATWAAGSYSRDAGRFVARFEDVWFLTDPQLFVAKHFPRDSAWTLLDDKLNLPEFLNHPITYNATARKGIVAADPRVYKIKTTIGQGISFQFRTLPVCGEQRAALVVVNSAGSRLSSYSCFQRQGDTYTLNHIFKKKGRYVVHVVVEEETVLSWEVEVGR